RAGGALRQTLAALAATSRRDLLRPLHGSRDRPLAEALRDRIERAAERVGSAREQLELGAALEVRHRDAEQADGLAEPGRVPELDGDVADQRAVLRRPRQRPAARDERIARL